MRRSERNEDYRLTGGGMGQQSLFGPGAYASAGTLQILNTSVMKSGLDYQRPVSRQAVDKLIRQWDDLLFEPPVVSVRDGEYYLVDGQRRVSAIRKMNDGKDANVMCRVLRNLTYHDEAMLVYRLDKAKTRMTLAQSTKARMESGHDRKIRNIYNLLEKEGFFWMLNGYRIGNYKINATRAVIRAYQDLGSRNFSWMFALLRCAWHGSPASLSAMMLNGMTLLLKTYERDIDESIFIHRVGAVDAEILLEYAKEDTSSHRRDIRCARVLLNQYNLGCREARKLRDILPPH